MHKAPTNKPNDRQRWATPEWFVRALEAMTGRTIEVDLAAEAWSAKAPEWLGPGSTIAEDAFEVVWVDFWATAFLNPPFQAIGPWVERLIEQADRGLVTFLLVPDRTDQRWWHQLCRAPAAYVSFVEGRVAFEPPAGIKASSPMGGVVVWQVGGREPLLPLSLNAAAMLRLGRQHGRSAA